MSNAKDVEFSLKAVINKDKTKVLFAEADSDFTDVLLSFLTLQLGQIVKVLDKHYGDKAPVIGSLTTLYKGLANLDPTHFWTEGFKQMLINPRTSFSDECRKLKLDLSDAQPIKYFACEDLDCIFSKKRNMSMYYGVAICDCGKPLTRELETRNVSGNDANDGGVFLVNGANFIISDELLILPNVEGSAIQTLSKLGITDTDWGEIMNVTFGFNEIMDLLKGSLLSRTPLTDIILNNGQNDLDSPSYPLNLLPKVEKKNATNSSEIMVLKVIVQKSTNKLLFAQAEENFIDFLSSLLTIPLGGVECLMDGTGSVTNIGNLYRSVASQIDDKYFESVIAKSRLIEPKLAHGYLSEYQILPLREEDACKVYYYEGKHQYEELISLSHNMGGPCVKVISFNFLKGQGSYVKRPRTYMVRDDLSVTPLCMTSYLSNLSALKIPLSDVTELVLHVGLEEALGILKASLVSKSALSNGLNPQLMKKPKLEQ